MSYSFVQIAAAATSTTVQTSWSAGAFGSNNTAGNLIAWFCLANVGSGTPTLTVTDTAGNTYAQAGSIVVSATEGLWWGYAKNIKGGANTANVSLSVGCNYVRLCALEYAGLDTVNPFVSGQIASQSQPGLSVPTATNGISSGNTPTLASQPAALVGMSLEYSTGQYVASGTGFNTRLDGSATAYGQDIEDIRLTSTSAVAATFTSTGPGSGTTGSFLTGAMVLNEAVSTSLINSGGKLLESNGKLVTGALMFMPLSWTINRRNKLAKERRSKGGIVLP